MRIGHCSCPAALDAEIVEGVVVQTLCGVEATVEDVDGVYRSTCALGHEQVLSEAFAESVTRDG